MADLDLSSPLSTRLPVPTMPRLTLGFLLVLLAHAGLAAQTPPNLLVVIADDLGVDGVSVYGEGTQPPPTPVIDALAARGVLFRNAWANPVCSPTRACLLTGRHSFRTGIGTAILPNGNAGVLLEEEWTLPEVLDWKRSGYATALIGKWHLGDQRNGGLLSPNLAGFDHFAGFLAGNVNDYFDWPRVEDGVQITSTVYNTTAIVDDALTWIATAQEPWLCIVSFGAPHAPFHAPPSHLHTQNLTGLTPRTTPTPFWKAMVEAMDAEMGRLFTQLGPVLARTNTIFLGDNGTPREVSEPPFLPSHAKSSAYEGAVNVPLIVAGPAVGASPREESVLLHAVDLFPTLLELAGVDAQLPFVHVDGVSCAARLADPTLPAPRTMLFAEFFDIPILYRVNGFVMARDERYKLIRRFNLFGVIGEELYDLTNDPFETHDLNAGPLGPAEALRFQALSQELVRVRDLRGSWAGLSPANCVGTAGLPMLGHVGQPRRGETYTVTLTNAPSNAPVLLTLGASNVTWFGGALPFDLQLFGAGTGCALQTSLEVTLPLRCDGSGRASVGIPVPLSPTLMLARGFHQWIVLDPLASSLGVTTSDAAGFVVDG